MSRGKGIDWDAQPLGEVLDRELADRLGVTNGSVALQRRKRGISSVFSKRYVHIDWDIQPLGELSDNALAEQLGVHYRIVKEEREKRRLTRFGSIEIDWDVQPLGVESDAQIARCLGVSYGRVKSARQKRGISPKPKRDLSASLTSDEYAICGHCECLFVPSRRQLKRLRSTKNKDRRASCSSTCADARRQKPRKERPLLGPCLTCGKRFRSLRTEKIYCNLECWVSSDQFKKQLEVIGQRGAERVAEKAASADRGEDVAGHPRVQYTCLECGKKWYGNPRRRKKFCCHAHYRAYMAKRFDRWIANPEEIALPQAYDEFMSQEELPCLIEGCTWRGQHLGSHVNLAHGIPVEEFKRAAGFNLTTGLVSPDVQQRLTERSHIHNASFPPDFEFQYHPPVKAYFSLEGREHRAKAMALRRAIQPGPLRVCRSCGVEFHQKGVIGFAMYCSVQCRSKFYARDRGNQLTVACGICGELFKASKHQRFRHEEGHAVFCNVKCRQINNGAVGGHTKRLRSAKAKQ